MPHGTPDWWGVEPTDIVYQVQDAGEAAARQGSIDIFDRRGNVFFLDGFEEGLAKWETGGSGTGHKEEISATYAENGALSCRLRAGSSNSHFAYIWRNVYTPSNKQVGIEVWYKPVSQYESLGVVLEYYDGTLEHDAAVRLNFSTSKIEYRDDLAAWVELDDLISYPATGVPFYPLKLVVDFDTDLYKRLIHADAEYPMASLQFYTTADARAPSMTVTISHVGVNGQNGELYVENVILTQNEP
jgi:hypothetical protein